MSVDFDQQIVREHTDSLKFDGRMQVFGRGDVNPLWVADMDFAMSPAIQSAITARLQHPILGYSLLPDSFFQAVTGWFQRRYEWRIEREWIVPAPGVVSSLNAACLAFAGAGEGVIVQPPVYHPFSNSVKQTGRRLLQNTLIRDADGYRMDIAGLENLAADTKLLLLCSPHNPVGRVWRKEELHELLTIARRHNLYILADEIHADLIYPEHQHTPLASVGGEFADYIAERVVTATSPNKSFNIPGLGLSYLIAQSVENRRKLQTAYELINPNVINPLSVAAVEAAYQQGEEWLQEVLDYLDGNRKFVAAFLAQHLPSIHCDIPEGTYLMWLDCRALGMSDKALQQFFIERCGLGLSAGVIFGDAGSGFMRLNIGTQRQRLHDALLALAAGVNELLEANQ